MAGTKRPTHLATFRSSDRNVLQIWIAGTQPSCGRHGLMKRRVDAAGLIIHQHRKRVEVSAFEFDQMAAFHDLRRQRMLMSQLLQNFLIRTGTRLSFTDDGQLQICEQYYRKLLWRVDVECPACHGVDLGRQSIDFNSRQIALTFQFRNVDTDAGKFHLRENSNKRRFQCIVQRCEAVFLQAFLKSCCDRRQKAKLAFAAVC